MSYDSSKVKELSAKEIQSIIGGYAPPTEEQLEGLNPLERIIICW